MKTIALAFTLALLSAFLALPGCGATPEQTARHTVDAIGVGINIADQVSAQQYTDRARAALAASTSMAEYQASMATMDAVERTLRVADVALHIADAAVRVWNQGGVASWPQALSCVVGALVGIRDAFVAAGIELPVELTAALDMVHGAVSGDGCFVDAGVPGGA